MKQHEAIEKLCQVLRDDDAVRAVFLKGSMARNDWDQYSDVDLYCLVEKSGFAEFLGGRLGYLEQYRPLLFWSEVDFVGPQIVAVFDNGLHLDLYAVTLDTLQKTDQIKILYDPGHLLESYVPEPLVLAEENVIAAFNGLSFSLLEFEAAYCRKDLLWAARLASHLSGDLALILRYLYDINNSKLGLKRLHESLDQDLYRGLIKAMDLSGPSSLPKGVVLLAQIAGEALRRLPTGIFNR